MANAGLVLDKGFDGYGEGWDLPDGAKAEFLKRFVASYPARGAGYGSVMQGRSRTLESLRARPLTLECQSRLTIGLGLPSPVETGFLFDRRTGAPFIPGSSVKGLARATAALIAAGEIETDAATRAHWSPSTATRVFGGPAGTRGGLQRGETAFFDAFPLAWPRLEVDVLTTHHKDYYTGHDSRVAAADWDEPVPIAFLTVAAGTKIVVYFAAPNEEDAGRIETVLRLGFEWLGIGAKKSSGYGVLGKPQPDAVAATTTTQAERKTWLGVSIELLGSQVRAAASPRGPVATGSSDLLAPRDRQALRASQPLRADVDVRSLGGKHEIVAIRVRREPRRAR